MLPAPCRKRLRSWGCAEWWKRSTRTTWTLARITTRHSGRAKEIFVKPVTSSPGNRSRANSASGAGAIPPPTTSRCPGAAARKSRAGCAGFGLNTMTGGNGSMNGEIHKARGRRRIHCANSRIFPDCRKPYGSRFGSIPRLAPRREHPRKEKRANRRSSCKRSRG